jgi:hypothetical protein
MILDICCFLSGAGMQYVAHCNSACTCPADTSVCAVLQASLRDKTKQLKAMASELNMYQAQVRATLHFASCGDSCT